MFVPLVYRKNREKRVNKKRGLFCVPEIPNCKLNWVFRINQMVDTKTHLQITEETSIFHMVVVHPPVYYVSPLQVTVKCCCQWINSPVNTLQLKAQHPYQTITSALCKSESDCIFAFLPFWSEKRKIEREKKLATIFFFWLSFHKLCVCVCVVSLLFFLFSCFVLHSAALSPHFFTLSYHSTILLYLCHFIKYIYSLHLL